MTADKHLKRAVRELAEREGISYTAAHRRLLEGARHEGPMPPQDEDTAHMHTPLPDMTILLGLPYALGRDVDTDLAARLVAACRSGCWSCQNSLSQQLSTRQRPTLAALAGAVYGGAVGRHGVTFASVATRWWAPLAQAAAAGNDVGKALAAVEAMDAAAASGLLEDALDHWTTGTPLQSDDGTPYRVPDAMDAFRAAGGNGVRPEDVAPAAHVDAYGQGPKYGLFVGVATPGGHVLPMLTLYPETEDAGIRDLERRTDWQHWNLSGLPETKPGWQLRARVADHTLRGIVHVDADGRDDLELWRASEEVPMPSEWWDMLDRTQHLLLVGPVQDAEHQALAAASEAGELVAVIARVSFQ